MAVFPDSDVLETNRKTFFLAWMVDLNTWTLAWNVGIELQLQEKFSLILFVSIFAVFANSCLTSFFFFVF